MTGLEMRKTKMQMSVFNLCWMAILMNIYRRQNGQCSALCCVNFINETITLIYSLQGVFHVIVVVFAR